MTLSKLAKEIHDNAIAHGWWETPPSFPEIIALCHSELSEALEEYRNYGDVNDPDRVYCPEIKGCAPSGIPTELADCIIRILDYCAYAEIDIEDAIHRKHEYNKTRPYRHGGKRL